MIVDIIYDIGEIKVDFDRPENDIKRYQLLGNKTPSMTGYE